MLPVTMQKLIYFVFTRHIVVVFVVIVILVVLELVFVGVVKWYANFHMNSSFLEKTLFQREQHENNQQKPQK